MHSAVTLCAFEMSLPPHIDSMYVYALSIKHSTNRTSNCVCYTNYATLHTSPLYCSLQRVQLLLSKIRKILTVQFMFLAAKVLTLNSNFFIQKDLFFNKRYKQTFSVKLIALDFYFQKITSLSFVKLSATLPASKNSKHFYALIAVRFAIKAIQFHFT